MTAAITALTTLGTLSDAVESSVARNLELLGSATVVEAEWDFDRATRWHHGAYDDRDLAGLRQLPGVVDAAPVVWKYNVRIQYEKHSARGRIAGVDGSYFSVVPLHAAVGRQLDQDDHYFRRQNCTIGSELAAALFGSDDYAVGKTINCEGVSFKVVGVCAWNVDPEYGRTVLIPLSVAVTRIEEMNQVRHIRVRAENWDVVPKLYAAVEAVLINNRPGYSDAVSVWYYKDRIANIKVIGLLVKGICILATAIALLLGSAAIYSLMSAVVTERTREIGLRIALGATPTTIRIQFLCEAIAVSLMAAAFGIPIGLTITQLAAVLMHLDTSLALCLKVLAAALGVAVVLGLVAGLAPAAKAGRLSCVEALHFE